MYNTEYALNEFKEHGEIWLQQVLKQKLNTILDVGSNIGEWTKMARQYNPQADIHTFEIIPETYQRMLANITIDDKIHPNGFGLSNYNGILSMVHNLDYPATSTFVKNLIVNNSKPVEGIVVKGDDYLRSREIEQVDFLKIDTEGGEESVLKGFEDSLRQGKIKIIQFEYGYICVLTKWLLKDAYEFLRPLGFYLGRLHNGMIEFHEYSIFNETFNGPDYVAVHESIKHEFGL